MEYAQLIEKALFHYENKIPFVLFSLPDDCTIKAAFLSKNNRDDIETFSENTFIMAPFQPNEELLQIPFKDCEIYEVAHAPSGNLLNNAVTISERKKDKQHHMAMVAKAIQEIETGRAQKIVVSREKKVPLSNFSIPTLCESLFSDYKDAFTYIWYHPQSNIWCGATPEVLLQTDGLNFHTMALAGTQSIADKIMIQWTSKERMEQKWVSDAIIESLENKTSVLKVSKTTTHIAGNLAHLKTDLTGVLNAHRVSLEQLAKALHPTPAVCGTPRDLALNFISEEEGYQRRYYTGFLGTVGTIKGQSKLFVNLRCMSIQEDTATLYAGGGITFDSIPEDEWNETHNKLLTMAKVLQPLL